MCREEGFRIRDWGPGIRVKGCMNCRDEGEVLPSGQPEGTGAPEEEGIEPPSQLVEDQSAAASSVPSPGANSSRLLTTEAKPVVKLRPLPLRMGASGLPEVPFPDFREAQSFQGRRLSKPVFLTSIRLIRGLCCYGCNVSFAIGELSSHMFSDRHQQMGLGFRVYGLGFRYWTLGGQG